MSVPERVLEAVTNEPKHREPLMDNVKAALILLVVIGHFISANKQNPFVMRWLYTVVYLFHMPLFVLVSGYFAKSVYQNGRYRYKRILSTLLAYLFFQLIYAITFAAFGRFNMGDMLLFTQTDAQWYLMALMMWYLCLPFFQRIKPAIALPATVVLALLSGYVTNTYFLSLTRVVNFLPYFLAGYYLSLYGKNIMSWLNNKWVRILSAICACAVAVGVGLYLRYVGSIPYLYRDISYANATDILTRVFNGACAVALGLGFFAVCPRRKMLITYLGARTMQVYVYHIIVYYILVFSGAFETMLTWSVLIRCLLVPVGLTLLLSLKLFCYPFRWFDRLDPQRFLIVDNNCDE